VLTQLFIKDLAVVDTLEFELEGGFTVFTGETGAGKSILVEALGLALGDRADSDMIRQGAGNATVTALFDLEENSAAFHFLLQQGVEQDGECIIRRHISTDGRSRGFINDTPVSMSTLRALGALLVDIHSQHEHQSLLQRSVQRDLLDEFAGHEGLLEETEGLFDSWRSHSRELEALRGDSDNVEAQLELLQFQLEELAGAGVDAESIASIEREHGRLANQSKLLAGVAEILDAIEGRDGAARECLSSSARMLDELKRFDVGLEAAGEMLSQALVAADETGAELRQYLAGLESEPDRLAQLDAQLATLHDLARKHRCRPHELAGRLNELTERAAYLQSVEQRERELRESLTDLEKKYFDTAVNLHNSRSRHAGRMSRQITKIMRDLGIPDGEFSVAVRKTDLRAPRAIGMDDVEFLVATNVGQDHRPLSKIVSGGELSRISLAIQVTAVGKSGVGTLVFDEVDAGIGGRVAEVVGQKLADLGKRRQVLCVTHLAQVASLAEQHLLVSKHRHEDTTQTRVQDIEGAARMEEIARMLGGADLTEKSLAHAREMLSMSAE